MKELFMRLQFFCLLGMSVILTGCAALSRPTLTERAAKNAEFYGKGQAAVVGIAEKGPDYETAAGYYERAARNGSAESAYALAALYRDTQIVDKDDETTRAKDFF
jgi:TPR repeat protein